MADGSPRAARRPPLTVALIRHALAGRRDEWTGPDALRPLTTPGQAQARALVRLLREVPISRVLSSPTLRCLQTVTPLASDRGVAIEPASELAEGRADDAIGLVSSLASESIAACTHGEVVPHILRWVAGRGITLPPEPRWEKSSVWLLHTNGGKLTGASYLEPVA